MARREKGKDCQILGGSVTAPLSCLTSESLSLTVFSQASALSEHRYLQSRGKPRKIEELLGFLDFKSARSVRKVETLLGRRN
jgi:hypothetical protein